MQIRRIITLMTLCLSLPAAADFTTVSLAHEVALSNFWAPASHNASAIFKTCDDCEPLRVRVTADTRYRVNNQLVTLKEFRKNIFQVRERSSQLIIVLHHLESNTVEQVSVAL